MSTHIPVMQVAFELVQQAENADIPIAGVDTYGDGDYMSVRLVTEDEDDAPRLAALLGLTNRRTQPHNDRGIEAFSGRVGIASVYTQHDIPADLVEVA